MCVYLHLSLCLYLHLYLCWYLYLRLYLCQSTLFTPARRRHRVTKCVHLIQNSTWSAFTLFQTQFKVCFLSKHSWSVFSFPQSSNTMLNVSVNTQCVFTHSLHSLCVQGLNTFSPSFLSSCFCCYWRGVDSIFQSSISFFSSPTGGGTSLCFCIFVSLCWYLHLYLYLFLAQSNWFPHTVDIMFTVDCEYGWEGWLIA